MVVTRIKRQKEIVVQNRKRQNKHQQIILKYWEMPGATSICKDYIH